VRFGFRRLSLLKKEELRFIPAAVCKEKIWGKSMYGELVGVIPLFSDFKPGTFYLMRDKDGKITRDMMSPCIVVEKNDDEDGIGLHPL